MKIKLPSSQMPEGDKNKRDPLCRVVILYDEIDAGKRAVNLASRLANRCVGSVILNQNLWRLGMLDHAEWREAAADEILNADILTIAAVRSNPLTESLETWLTDLIYQKCGTKAAVVALFGSGEGSENISSSQHTALQTAAWRAGLDFFSSSSFDLCSQLNANIERIHRRAETVTPVMDEILHEPSLVIKFPMD